MAVMNSVRWPECDTILINPQPHDKYQKFHVWAFLLSGLLKGYKDFFI